MIIARQVRLPEDYRRLLKSNIDAIDAYMYPTDTLFAENHTSRMNLKSFIAKTGCDYVAYSHLRESPMLDLTGMIIDSEVIRQWGTNASEINEYHREFDTTTVYIHIDSFFKAIESAHGDIVSHDDFIVDVAQSAFVMQTNMLDDSLSLALEENGEPLKTVGVMNNKAPAWLVLQSSGMFGLCRVTPEGLIEGYGAMTLTSEAQRRVVLSHAEANMPRYDNHFGTLYSPQTSQLFLMHLGRRFKRFKEKLETIEVRKSILSRVSNAQLSIPKELFLASSYLEKGTRFLFKHLDKYDDEIALSLWVENDMLCMAHEPIGNASQGGVLGTSVKTMDVVALPDRITTKEIQKMFKFGKTRERVRKKAEFREVFETMGLEHSRLEGAARDFENYLTAESVGMYLDPTDGTTKYDYELPGQLELATKLICALNSPEMRGSLKTVKVSTGIDPKTVRKALRNRVPKMRVERKLVWGTDRVQYVYPGGKKRKGNTAARYVRPHLCRFYIKDYDKYAIYDPVGPDDKSRYSIIKERRGHWTGKVPPDVTYSLGREPSNYSRMAINWLNKISKEDNIDIQHAENGGELRVELGSGRYYLLDGYCEETNTAYEFNGDVWHGNPECFAPDATPHPHSDVTAQELYESQMEKERILNEMGFNVVSIWERDYRKGALA
tara:strand:- start:579 stop:2573 length:1995 start_codon:yes stop_codon:yes gene_type:complete